MNDLSTFEFEKLYQKELDRIYEELGYEIIQRIQGEKNKYYDLILSKNGKKAKIEEKALQYYHRDCPIELIQNILPLDLGWFYETKADYLHYLYYQDLQPIILYQISIHKLKKNLLNIVKERNITARFSTINYGITLNMCIKWSYLLENKYAFILKKW
ncbi:MAG: hypothetical protein ACTSRA_12530 [Promethearchaeota archaeon]